MPLLWLGLAFIAGVRLSAGFSSLSPLFAALIPLSAFALAGELRLIPPEEHCARSHRLIRLPISALVLAFALGGWRFQAALPAFDAGALGYYQPAKNVTLTGLIASYPQNSEAASVAILRAEQILVDGRLVPVDGKLELRLPPGFHLTYGERVRLTGDLKPAGSSGKPIQSSYLARRGIDSRMAYPRIEFIGRARANPAMTLLFGLRSRAYDALSDHLPAREASLLAGILLGMDWTIPRYLTDAYRRTSAIHIIAISGFNITLIAWQVIRLFRRFFKPAMASASAVFVVIAYTLLVGADPAVVRAALMGSLAIPAHFLGRRLFGVHSLVAAAALMLAVNPFLLWDLGFQLSFLATLGLMVLADPLLNFLSGLTARKWGQARASRLQPLYILALPTLIAQFAVSPVLHQLDAAIHLYALPANLLILPVQPLVMVLGGMGVLTGLIFPPLGGALLSLAWPIVNFCNEIALRLALLPKAALPAPAASPALLWLLVAIPLALASFRQIRAIGRPAPEAEDARVF